MADKPKDKPKSETQEPKKEAPDPKRPVLRVHVEDSETRAGRSEDGKKDKPRRKG